MISVVTPTVRPEGLALVEKALREQSFRDWEWIVVTPFVFYMHTTYYDGNEALPKDDPFVRFVTDQLVVVPEPEKKKNDVWSLNKAYNAGIKKAKGELLISWQDFTYAKPDTLQNFWKHFEDEPKTLVSAVGNKYETDSWDVMTWKDPREREDLGSYYQCYFADIEANLASIPTEALYSVGGFDEKMDKYYGLDFYNVVHRLAKRAEYDFKLDQSIKSYSLEHGRLNGDNWDKLNWLTGGRYDEYSKTQPTILPFLTREK